LDYRLEWYFAFSTWPPEVRDDLKRAIKARNRGDIGGSEKLFQRYALGSSVHSITSTSSCQSSYNCASVFQIHSAIDKARSLPLPTLGQDPLLKLTGLYITLAAMHESAGQPRKAFRTLQTGLGIIDRYSDSASDPTSTSTGARRSSPDPGAASSPDEDAYVLTSKDHTRAIAISQKLGSLALQASEPGQITRPYTPGASSSGAQRTAMDREWEGLAEKYLVRALEGMISLGAPRELVSATPSKTNSEATKVVGRDFIFPDEQDSPLEKEQDKGDREISGESIAKVTRKSMGLTMESLADLYARQGKFE
jgi:hypothetical protein